jgi:lysozyme family protein
MRQNFESAFRIVVGLEGDPVVDEGGLTVFGLAQKYNPMVSLNMKIGEAKEIYLNKYWIPTGCDTAPFPLDICLFDARVNPQDDPGLPGGSMQELLNQHPENWQDYLFFRMQRYKRCSKPKYKNGHIDRILKLHEEIKKLR